VSPAHHPGGVAYRTLADVVMLVHFGFLVFLTLGGFLAWRMRWVLVPHAIAVAWAVLILLGATCPLTTWENALRQRGGEPGLPRGFIDTYLTGVVYPQAYLRPAQLLVAGAIAVSWLGLAVRHTGASRDRRVVDGSGHH
jgi:Protein of Unknown function (DUF2784)